MIAGQSEGISTLGKSTLGFILFIVGCAVSCGGGSSPSTPPSPPPNNTCSGALISGTLQDSLSGQPVVGARAVLESGTRLSVTPVYNFFPKQTAVSDQNGAFRICASSVPTPSVLVIVALDASGKAYPPFLSEVSGTNDLGIILMGSCRFICGFEGQQQTSLPVTISGAITSAPVAKLGAVFAQLPTTATDGSMNIWSIAVPDLSSGTNSFATQAGSCPDGAPFCSSYSFTLPSQRFVRRVPDGYVQESAPPGYVIYAAIDSAPLCTVPYAFTIYAEDGKSLLTGAPGADLKAATIRFVGCE